MKSLWWGCGLAVTLVAATIAAHGIMQWTGASAMPSAAEIISDESAGLRAILPLLRISLAFALLMIFPVIVLWLCRSRDSRSARD